jgi:hypothetical protein
MEFVKGFLALLAALVVWDGIKCVLFPRYTSKRFRKELSRELHQCFASHQAQLLTALEIYFEQLQEKQDHYGNEVDHLTKHILQELLVAVQTLKAAPDNLEVELTRALELVLSKSFNEFSAEQKQNTLSVIKEIKEIKLTT